MQSPRFTENSRRIFDLRYPRKGEDGKPAEAPEDTILRVATNVASVNAVYSLDDGTRDDYGMDVEHFPARTAVRLAKSLGVPLERINQHWDKASAQATKYYDMISSWDFLPNSPTWTGAGTPLGQLAACFVLPIADDLGQSRDSIFETLKVAALIQQTGGGNGFSFGRLRPAKALIERSMGQATGPIGFMSVYDSAFGMIAQGGSRRGANMGVLPVWHSDIRAFMTSKTEEGVIANFNISVALTDSFMEAVDKDSDFNLGWYRKGEFVVTETIRARDLWQEIAQNAWIIGDPGNLFIDRANQFNPVPTRYTLEATNPCFHPDTMIETVHGPKRIADITEPTEVLTKGPSGGIEVRKATASFITARDAQTVIIRLSNGRSLTVTPNHEIMLVDGTYVAAESLRPGDRVEALCQARRGSAYVGVKLASQPNRDYRMKHRVIYEGVHGRIPEGFDINHIDRDTFNNDIDNFEVLTHAEHAVLTRSQVPNDHQVQGGSGRFVSGPDSRGGAKTIRHLPEHLSSAWRNQPRVLSVEPGPVTDVYDITVDETHNVIADFVVAHNCGEQWLGPYENCCLGSINLANFAGWDTEGFDWDRFADTVHLATEFLDDVVDANQYVDVVPELAEAAAGGRRIGLGLMGLADAMLKMGLRYGSIEGLAFASQVTEFARFHTMLASIERARQRGPFGWYKDSIYDIEADRGVIKGLDGKQHSFWTPPIPLDLAYQDYNFGRPALDWQLVINGISAHGIRNSCQFTFAPTGTISNVAALEGSGCEPLFALVYYRTVMQEGENIVLPYASPLFYEALVRAGKSEEEIERIVEQVRENGGSCQGLVNVPQAIQDVFVVAGDVTWEEHVRTQAVLQRFVDNSISKTINMPNEATVEDVANAYRLAYDLGCKGITIYRQGSRDLEVLSTSKKVENDQPLQMTEEVWPVIRPLSIPTYAYDEGLASRVFPVETPFGKVQVTITELDGHEGRPFDLRIQLGKAGNDKNADVEALGRSISLALRAGVDVTEVVDQLEGIGGQSVHGFGPRRVRSVADGVAKLLKRRYVAEDSFEAITVTETVAVKPALTTLPGADPERTCPRCNLASIIVESGCAHCDPRLGGCGSWEGCE